MLTNTISALIWKMYTKILFPAGLGRKRANKSLFANEC